MTRRTFMRAVVAVLTALGIKSAPKPRPNDCPQCGRLALFCCSNRDCTCWQGLKQGEQPLVPLLPPFQDVLTCPYCGYAEHIDGWFERQMSGFRDRVERIAQDAK